MAVVIDTSGKNNLNWGATGLERKAQNVLNLINTWRYEVAYNRTLGINPDVLDKPAPLAAALYTAEVQRIIQDNEPGIKIKSIDINGISSDGNIDAVVVIET